MTYTSPQFLPPVEAAQRATRKGIVSIQAALRPSCQNTPVQRPLARRRVMLSRQVTAYYGLIRHSRSLRSIYGLVRTVFARRSGLGWSRELPQFTLCGFPCVPPSVPRWAQWLREVVTSPPVRVFANSVMARHPHTAHADSHTVRVTRLQSSLNVTARKVACPSSARAFTSELSPPRVTPKKVSDITTWSTTNYQDRTFTGKPHSLMGCKRMKHGWRKKEKNGHRQL